MNKEVVLSPRELRDNRINPTNNGVTPEEWGYVEPREEEEFILDDFIVDVQENIDRIGGLFPIGRLSLLYGAIGSGKSYLALNVVTNNDIVPFYVNLDATGGLEDFNKHQLGSEFIEPLFDGRADDTIRGSVVIIDTYTKLAEHPYFLKLSNEEIVGRLEELCVCAGVTLIIIGHAEEFVGSSDIFQSNVPLQRSAYESILINKKYREKTRGYDKGFYFDVRLLKGRGIGGAHDVKEYSRIVTDIDMEKIMNKAKEI